MNDSLLPGTAEEGWQEWYLNLRFNDDVARGLRDQAINPELPRGAQHAAINALTVLDGSMYAQNEAVSELYEILS